MTGVLKAIWRIAKDAFGHFNNDDGWAMASHVALSTLMALFPFLIFATTLGSFLGADSFADTAVHIIFDTWPERIAEPIAREVADVLTVQRGDLLTVSVIAAAFFASNGIEALRVSLNRAYRVRETRSFLFMRAQSLVFVIIATFGFLVVSVLLVLAPLAIAIAGRWLPWLQEFVASIDFWRYVIAVQVLIVGLFAVHLWLPDGKRSLLRVLPGIVLTLITWLIAATTFAAYLATFANYVNTYAGLASIVVALVFLYMMSVIFIMGGEINAAIMRYRARLRDLKRPANPA